MAPGQYVVHNSAIRAVAKTLLTALKRKASPGQSALRQQLCKENVGAQMHVMMTVNPLSGCPIEAIKFLQLGLNHVSKRTGKSGMKDDLGEAGSTQVHCKPSMMFEKFPGTAAHCKWSSQIQVKAGINPVLPR